MNFPAYLRLTRAPGAFTVISNITAAHVVAVSAAPQWVPLLLTIMVSLGLYHSGMVINDIVDIETDRQERPERPLVSGIITIASARRFAALLMIGAIALSVMIGPAPLIISLVLAGLILFYNLVAKQGPLGPLVMAACRYTNWMLGLSVVTLSPDLALIALPLPAYVYGLTLLSRQETSLGTVPSVRVSMVLLVLAGGLVLFNATVTGAGYGVLSGFVILMVATLLLRLAQLAQRASPERVQGMVTVLIMGLIPLDALIVFSQGAMIEAVLILLLILPASRVARYIYVT
ncbi:MAG: UbiA family prenyltransferase [Gammaproteobacteria bacterium]|nr:UbiA family prenyltransferase [Gammaproteobacteria bacterium]